MKPRKRAVVMVIPERLVPGIRARVCDRPMRMASLRVKSSSVRVAGDFLSAIHNRIPKINVVHATISVARSHDGSSMWRARPASITGIDPIMM